MTTRQTDRQQKSLRISQWIQYWPCLWNWSAPERGGTVM